MITIVIKNNTPAPTAPKTVLMFWPVFSDFDSTKSKLLYTGENKKSVKAKKGSKYLFSKIDRHDNNLK